MPDSLEDLRSTEESILQDAKRVSRLEEEKQSRDPSDPEVLRLSLQVEDVAHALADKASIERSLSEELPVRD